MKNPAQQIKIFIDFDGTITTEDVGEKIFLETVPPEVVQPILDDIVHKRIDGRQGWKQLFDAAPGLSVLKILEIANGIEIDAGFKDFLEFCATRNLPAIIISDGFEEYIKPILAKHTLSHLTVFANKLRVNPEGKLQPMFPYTDEECRLCANCKRNHLVSRSSDDDITVYIGNGSSDTCPAEYADYVFAKDALLKHCERERISYFRYRNFRDVILRLSELIDQKKLKKLHRAVSLRKQLYKLG